MYVIKVAEGFYSLFFGGQSFARMYGRKNATKLFFLRKANKRSIYLYTLQGITGQLRVFTFNHRKPKKANAQLWNRQYVFASVGSYGKLHKNDDVELQSVAIAH